MLDRRRFLLATTALLGTRPASADEGHSAAQLLQNVGSPQDLATPLAWFDRLLTPSEVFFVRSHFGPPSLDSARKLAVEGLVATSLSLTPDELRARFPAVTVTAVLQCAGNGRSFHRPRAPGVQWGHGAMGQATFTGARLRDVLAAAGPLPEAAHVSLGGADLPPKPTVPAFVRSIPLARALDPSTLIAWAMNGQPLTLAHGAPLRLVVPGWAGDHWTKWLTHVALQRQEADGFFMQTAYKIPTHPVEPGASVKPEELRSLTTFPVKSVIAQPADGSTRPPGRQELAGCAFSGDAPLAKVELSIDSGKTWRPAALDGEAGTGRWQVWKFHFDSRPGTVTALVRATDRAGNAQPEKPTWNPSGYFYNAWHSVTWEVA
jgi:DMSO/TMAO reductase YedYZ molybdopterin-dependent catalytic subunit